MSALPRAFGAFIVVGSCLLGGHARADEPTPPERDTSPKVFPSASAQPNLLLIGGVVTAVWYGAAVGTSYLWSDSPSAPSLRIPVAGPYMALAKTGCGDDEPGCGPFNVVLRTIFTSLSAIGQTGGVLAMVEGVVLPTATARADVAGAFRIAGRAGGAEVRLEPRSGASGEPGFALLGAF